MKLKYISLFLLCISCNISSNNSISKEDLIDKFEGFWLGQSIANWTFEMRYVLQILTVRVATLVSLVINTQYNPSMLAKSSKKVMFSPIRCYLWFWKITPMLT